MKILFTKIGIEKEVFEKLGDRFRPEFCELIRTEKTESRSSATDFTAAIFTSSNAVLFFLQSGYMLSSAHKIFTVGQKAQALLEANGHTVSHCSRNAEALAQYLIAHHPQETYRHFCGSLVLPELEEQLAAQEIAYTREVLYTTTLLEPKFTQKYDAVVFFSPSGVRSFAAHNSLEGLRIFSIGKTTTAEIRKYSSGEIFTSAANSLEDLLEMILQER